MGEAHSKKARLADVIDAVRWDYDPEGVHLSPLVSADRYFRDFPWEPEDVFEAEAPEAEDGGDG